MKEEFRCISGTNGNYKISNFGRVYSVRRDKYLKPGVSRGYEHVLISYGKIRKTKSIHRLVAESFIPNPCNKQEVNHKDLNKRNNHISNLEWISHKENIYHAINNSANILGHKWDIRYCGNDQYLINTVTLLHESILGERINHLFNKNTRNGLN